jgi:hypothetical protein
MKHRNLSLNLLAISFVLFFFSQTFAQRPNTSPTGSGDSTKTRPKDVSPTEVKKVLDAVKLPNTTTDAISNTTPTTPKPTAIIFDSTNPPDLTGTKWYYKFKYQSRLRVTTVEFNSEGKLKKEILGDGIILISGIWRQIGLDVFVSWNYSDGRIADNCQLKLENDGSIGGLCKDPSDGKITSSHLISDNFTSYRSRGDAYSGWEEYEIAISYYIKAIELEETNPLLYMARAGSYYNVGKYDLAILDYNKVFTLEPNISFGMLDSYELRGRCYLKQKNYQKAIDDFSEVINWRNINTKGSNSEFALTARIVAYEAIGKKDLADADRKTIAEAKANGITLFGGAYK